MFTGIVREIGKVKSLLKRGALVRLEVLCGGDLLKEIAIGASVAINGVCLSAVRKNGSLFFDVVENTFKKTNLKRLKISSPVNLEKALKLGDDVGGHMVSGHVDGERRIKRIQKSSDKCILEVSISPEDKKYLVSRGSVAIDGVSLTVAEVYGTFLRAYLIPHTIENTVLKFKKQNDYVNVEYDMAAKHIKNGLEGGITKDFLQHKGFLR